MMFPYRIRMAETSLCANPCTKWLIVRLADVDPCLTALSLALPRTALALLWFSQVALARRCPATMPAVPSWHWRRRSWQTEPTYNEGLYFLTEDDNGIVQYRTISPVCLYIWKHTHTYVCMLTSMIALQCNTTISMSMFHGMKVQ